MKGGIRLPPSRSVPLVNRASPHAPRFFISRPPFLFPRGGIFFSRPPFFAPRARPAPASRDAFPTPNPRVSIPIPTLGIINDRDARVTGRGACDTRGYIFPTPFFIFARGLFYFHPLFSSRGRIFLRPPPLFRVTRGVHFRGGTGQISPQSLSIKKKISNFLVLVVF